MIHHTKRRFKYALILQNPLDSAGRTADFRGGRLHIAKHAELTAVKIRFNGVALW
jgi:hypothetical protein